MWKAVSRSIYEAVERRIGFTAFRCDASNSKTPDKTEKYKRSSCQVSHLVPQLKSLCPLRKLRHGGTSSGSSEDKYHQNKQHEQEWDEPHIHQALCGAMGWSTAFVLGWCLSQPHARYCFFGESSGRCYREWCMKCVNLSPAVLTDAFAQPPIQPLSILPIHTNNKVLNKSHLYGSSSSNSTEDISNHEIFEDVNRRANRTFSLSSSTDTGVSSDDTDDLFTQHRGPFTPEEALNEASRVFAAASRSFAGDVENKLGMACVKKKEHFEAMRHFHRASHLDNASAAYNIGQCYELGLGTKQNLKKAAKWYKIASDRGHSVAKYNLAVFFAHGLGGLNMDKNQAYKLLLAASGLGLKEAEDALSFISSLSSSLAENGMPKDSQKTPFNDLLEMFGAEANQVEKCSVNDSNEDNLHHSNPANSYWLDSASSSTSSDEQFQNHIGVQFENDQTLKTSWGLHPLHYEFSIHPNGNSDFQNIVS